MGNVIVGQETAELKLDGKVYQLPIIVGSEGEKAIDIRALRAQTGYITLDSGFMNTGSCSSSITFLDGERGILSYRGYAIEDLAENCTFVEVAYLLDHGSLPTQTELNKFSHLLGKYAMVHEDMIRFFDGYPPNSPPMAILSSMVNSLCSFYPDMLDNPLENVDKMAARLLSKVRTIAAFSYKKSMGQPLVYPRHDLSYCANFLNMMFDSPVKPYEINDTVVRALNKLLILHGDHEQNCSTATVRVAGSARVNLYASISAGINALWGPLHGGANQAVIEMREAIQRDGGGYKKYVSLAKDKTSTFRLMGFGHRVYKNYDPRAKVLKEYCHKLLNKPGMNDPRFEVAMRLEEIALKDEYFVSRNLYPNVDFYSGLILKATGFPMDMFTVLFAIGRLPGWLAHWRELHQDPKTKIGRPQQLYTGSPERSYPGA